MAITVVSTSPVANETEVSAQARLQIVFSVAVKHSSVNDGTLLLYEADGAVSVPGTIEFSSDSTTVYFLPLQELKASWTYVFAAAGAADGLPAGAIQNASSEDLAETYSVTFRTGTERFVSLEEITDRTDIEHVAPIREESELAQVTAVLSIVSSDPEGFSSNQGDPDEIRVTFDGPLASSSFSSDWMTVEMRPILDYEDFYLGAYNSDDEKYLRIEDEDLVVTIPDGEVTRDGSDLVWTKTDSDAVWPFNAEVTITLSAEVEGEDGQLLGREVKIIFTTLLFPLYVGSQFLRLELGPAIRDFFDDTLNRIALKRAIEAWEISGREFSLRNPPYAAREYAKNGAILDVIEALAIKADLNRGQKKRLGDFEVDYGGKNALLDSAKHRSALSAFQKAEAKLRLWPRSLRARFAAVGTSSPTGPQMLTGMRNWDSLLAGTSRVVPAANWKDERELKSDLGQAGSLANAVISPSSVLSAFFGRFESTPFDRFFLIQGS